MLDSVWKVCGTEFDVDTFLDKYSIPATDNTYHKGDAGIGGRVFEDSGFLYLISDNLNSIQNINGIAHFIKKHEPAFSYLNKLGVDNEIAIGCTVGTEDQFTKSIIGPPDFLELLSRSGVSLRFSAYPASDDESEI